MAKRIPDAWKQAVLAILRGGDLDHIEIRKTSALIPFTDLFPFAFSYDLIDAFVEGVGGDNDLMGRQIHNMAESGTVWEFIFTYRRQKILGKVCLTPNNDIVIIYSAHAPRKGNEV